MPHERERERERERAPRIDRDRSRQTGSVIMDGQTLYEIVMKDELAKKNFKGIFNSDTIPVLTPGIVFVFNTLDSKSKSNIGHWILGHTCREGYYEHLDSLASNIDEFPHLKARVQDYGGKSFSFARPLQDESADSCPIWAAFINSMIQRGIFGPDIISRFFTPPLPTGKKYLNDIFVISATKVFYQLSKPTEEYLLSIEFEKEKKKSKNDSKCF